MKRIFFFLLVFIHVSLHAKEITVGRGMAYATLKQAIASAKDGDKILVYPGKYAEGEIIVDKRLYIKGIEYPVITGQGKYQIFSIQANNVVLEGFSIVDGGYSSMHDFAAIKVVQSRDVIIRNNKLLNNTFGIYFQNAKNSMVLNNLVQAKQVDEINSGNAIHCWKSDSITVANNVVTGHRDGIYFEFVTNSMVRKNRSFLNIRYGLHFMFSHNNSYFDNSFVNNGSGVAVMYTRKVIMARNIFKENWGSASYGILMKDISDSEVFNNTFIRNTVGVFMEGSSRINIKNNSFIENGWAMRVQASCNDNVIEKNNYQANSFDVGSNGDMQLNTFTGNYWDKYEGYDLNRDKVGDIPYRPVSLFSMVAERNPAALMLFRSFLVDIIDKSERVLPALIPASLIDEKPSMVKHDNKALK